MGRKRFAVLCSHLELSLASHLFAERRPDLRSSALSTEEIKKRLEQIQGYYAAAQIELAKVKSQPYPKGSRQYLEMEERLTVFLLQLDSIETGGHEAVRTARKRVVSLIQDALDKSFQ